MIISGCGNGNNLNSSTDAEVINGISVPPEPNPKKNNATLTGVDSNNNGVRDDVERKIAELSGKDKRQYEVDIAYAKKQQNYFLYPSPTTRDEALLIISKSECNSGLVSDFNFEKLTFNTKQRKAVFDEIQTMVVSYLGSELRC